MVYIVPCGLEKRIWVYFEFDVFLNKWQMSEKFIGSWTALNVYVIRNTNWDKEEIL